MIRTRVPSASGCFGLHGCEWSSYSGGLSTPSDARARPTVLLEATIHDNNTLWINHVLISLCFIRYPQQRESHTTSILDLLALTDMIGTVGQEGFEKVAKVQGMTSSHNGRSIARFFEQDSTKVSRLLEL